MRLKKGETKMRFMLIVKANKDSEAGVMPSVDLLNAMGKFNEEMVSAGVLLAAEGLQASSKGARVKFTPGARPSVVDGPFAETKELIAGFWLIQVKSKEEAIAWAMKSPAPHGPGEESEIEIRQVFDAADFGPDVARNEQALRDEMARRSVKG
jgi:hypothetical protein